MNIYDATIRLKGDTAHEVNKTGLTAAEIMVLRRIHGLDAVVRIVPTDAYLSRAPHTHREERDRLRKLYCDREETAMLVNELFGPDHIPLPITLDEEEEFVAEAAARDRELKDTNTTTVTQEQLAAMIEKAVTADRAERELGLDKEHDPDAPDPETGKYPDHIIAGWDAKRQAGLDAKAQAKFDKGAPA